MTAASSITRSVRVITSGEIAPPAAKDRTATPPRRHPAFRFTWIAVNILFLFCVAAALWTGAWEYSTRRYLKGFSDAIVPFSATPVQTVQAILVWMSHTPARINEAPASLDDDRDPTDTLNYASLLKVCGTATNAFINLGDSAGLTTRRLLLLDTNQTTVHVVAEVLIGGRWIVVDPTFHTIFESSDGTMLTRQDLAVPATFNSVTRNIPGYDPAYTFGRAVHIRAAKLGAPGRLVNGIFNTLLPNWEGSSALSLVVERESLGYTVLFTLAALILLLVRSFLRWYGEARLNLHPQRIRTRLRRLGELLLEPADSSLS
jgi:hypothetical protein